MAVARSSPAFPTHVAGLITVGTTRGVYEGWKQTGDTQMCMSGKPDLARVEVRKGAILKQAYLPGRTGANRVRNDRGGSREGEGNVGKHSKPGTRLAPTERARWGYQQHWEVRGCMVFYASFSVLDDAGVLLRARCRPRELDASVCHR